MTKDKDQPEKTEFVVGKPCWITKFALGRGIEENIIASVSEGFAWIKAYPDTGSPFDHESIRAFCAGTEVFATRKEAIEYAEGMKTKRIVALQREFDKLKALKFN